MMSPPSRQRRASSAPLNEDDARNGNDKRQRDSNHYALLDRQLVAETCQRHLREAQRRLGDG